MTELERLRGALKAIQPFVMTESEVLDEASLNEGRASAHGVASMRVHKALISTPAPEPLCNCHSGSSLPDGQHFVGCPLWRMPTTAPEPEKCPKLEFTQEQYAKACAALEYPGLEEAAHEPVGKEPVEPGKDGCPFGQCDGSGSYPEHTHAGNKPGDEHECVNCPVQVQCQCEGKWIRRQGQASVRPVERDFTPEEALQEARKRAGKFSETAHVAVYVMGLNVEKYLSCEVSWYTTERRVMGKGNTFRAAFAAADAEKTNIK